MKNLFGEEVEEKEAKKILKEKKEKPVYTIEDYDIYYIIDDEYYWFVCARSRGQAKAIYMEMNCIDGWDWVDVRLSIQKVKKLKPFIKEKYLGNECNPFDDKYWAEAIYKVGGSFYISEDYEDIKLSLEEMLARVESGDSENIYLDSEIKK